METEGELFTTVQNAAEYWNVSTRPATARGGFGRSLDQTDVQLVRIERAFTMLSEDPETYAVWHDLVRRYGVSGVQVHDARIVSVMMVMGISHVLTLNPTDFARYSEVTAVTPEQVVPQPRP